MLLLHRSKEAARFYVDVSYPIIIRPDAEDDGPACLHSLVLDHGLCSGGGERADDDRRADARDRGQFSYGFGVFYGHLFSNALGLRGAAEAYAYVVILGDKDQVGAEPFGLRYNELLEPCQERRDRDNGHRAADDAEHRERRAHLMRPQRVEGHKDVFAYFLNMHN